MGNEMGNNNVSGLQEQEKGEYEAPNEVQASDESNLKAENQPVTSPKEEGFDENDHKGLISEDQSGNGDSHIEKQDKIDPDNTKEEAADQSSKKLPLAKDASEKDVIVDEAASESKENSAETTGNKIQDGREPETDEVQSPDDSNKPRVMLDDKSVDGAESSLLSRDGSPLTTYSASDDSKKLPVMLNGKSVDGAESLLSRDGSSVATYSASDKNRSKTSDDEIQEQISIEKEPEPEPKTELKPELEPDTTMIQVPDTDSREEQIQSIPPSKDGSSYETVSSLDSDKSTSEANDQQTHKESLKEREGDEEMNSSPEITWTPVNSESMASTDQDADQLKPDSAVDAEPDVEDGIVSERTDMDILGSTVSRDSELNEERSDMDILGSTGIHESEVKEERTDMGLLGSTRTHDTEVKEERSDMDILGSTGTHDTEVIEERSDMDILGSSGTHDSEVKENALENESKEEQDESAFPGNIPEVETYDNEMHEEIEFQGEASQDNRKNEESQVGLDVGETFKTEPDSENGEAKSKVFKLNLDSEADPDLQNEFTAASESVESIQVGNSQSKEKLVVLTDDTYLSESQSSLNVGQEQETKVDDNSKNMTIDQLEHDDCNKGIATGEEKHDSRISSVSEEDKELETETQVLGEVSVHPTDPAAVDTNPEEVNVSASSLSDSIVQEAAPEREVVQVYLAKDAKETEMSKPMALDSDLTEPDPTHHVLSVETHTQDVKQDLTVVSSQILEDTINSNFEQKHEVVREVDVAEISNSEITNVMLIDSGYGCESDMELCSPESDESYRTAYEQENLSPIVKVEMQPSLHFAEPTVATEVLVAEMNNKDAKKETETSDAEVKHAVVSFGTELYSADSKMHYEVPRDERADVSLQTPLLYEEKKISEDFRTNCFGTEINPSKVGVNIAKPVAETKFTEKGTSDETPSEDQILEEKQVITMGRNSSEKLNVPLLNFLKEESYCLESEEKKGKTIGKKVNVHKWNSSDDKATGTIRGRGGAKRKPKPLFFNICMCCTTEIP